MTRPIHIRLINGYLEALVDPELLLKDLSMHSYSEQAWVSFLKYWTLRSPTLKLLLSVSFPVTLGGVYLRRMFSQRMQNVDGLSVWMGEKSVYLRILKVDVDTWQCQAISKMEKQL